MLSITDVAVVVTVRFHCLPHPLRSHLEEAKSNGVDSSFLVDVVPPSPDVLTRDLTLLAQQQEKLIAEIM